VKEIALLAGGITAPPSTPAPTRNLRVLVRALLKYQVNGKPIDLCINEIKHYDRTKTPEGTLEDHYFASTCYGSKQSGLCKKPCQANDANIYLSDYKVSTIAMLS